VLRTRRLTKTLGDFNDIRRVEHHKRIRREDNFS
jgi:hypothetical protein